MSERKKQRVICNACGWEADTRWEGPIRALLRHQESEHGRVVQPASDESLAGLVILRRAS